LTHRASPCRTTIRGITFLSDDIERAMGCPRSRRGQGCRPVRIHYPDEQIDWEEAVMLVINPHPAAELLVEGEPMPVFVWTIDHPEGRVLVDTGMIDSRPEFDDMSPTPPPENIPRDVACVINPHLHFDHCGGNRLFPGVPIHVQARELADARSLEDYTIREWVDFDGATYVEHEGEVAVLPGIRLLPAPGHTDGHQVVVVETGAGTNVLGGDVGVWFGDLESGTTEGKRRVLALGAPTWLSHAPGPEIPEHRPQAMDNAST